MTTLLPDLLHPSTPLLLSALLVIPLAYLYTSHASSTLFPTLHSSRILLLTAHPDDETMFFAPAVQALTRPELANHLKVLCLSEGGKDGLAEVRRKELHTACESLGLGKGDAMCLVDSQLQDGDAWSTSYIRDILLRTFAPSFSPFPASYSTSRTPNSPLSPRTPNPPPAETTIDALLTFDSSGVSTHPNHISCHAAALAFQNTIMKGHEGWESPVGVYTLRSVNILRKYSGILDVFVTILLSVVRIALRHEKLSNRGSSAAGERQGPGTGKKPSSLLYVSGPMEWWTGIRAMVTGHWSQMVWFRWGWVGLGRYMVVNDLARVR